MTTKTGEIIKESQIQKISEEDLKYINQIIKQLVFLAIREKYSYEGYCKLFFDQFCFLERIIDSSELTVRQSLQINNIFRKTQERLCAEKIITPGNIALDALYNEIKTLETKFNINKKVKKTERRYKLLSEKEWKEYNEKKDDNLEYENLNTSGEVIYTARVFCKKKKNGVIKI